MQIWCHGHENISATHRSSLELTRDPSLTRRGTCIVGVAGDWDDRALRPLRGRIRVRLVAGGYEDTFEAEVSRSATLLGSLVFRKGPDLRDRTFAFGSTAGAADLDRDLVEELASPEAMLRVEIESIGAAGSTVGTLYIVGLGADDVADLTPRSLRAIEGADAVVAEDRDGFRAFAREAHLTYGSLVGPRPAEVVARLRAGAKVALVSEGSRLGLSAAATDVVREVVAQGIPVVPVPGPNAPVAAVMAAGFPADAVLAVGSLPRRRASRRAYLASLAPQRMALVVTEAPQRLLDVLADLAELAPGRELFVGRELTRLHEERLYTTTDEAVDLLAATEPRGQYTLVVGPPPEPADDDDRPSLDPTTARLLQALRGDVPTRTLADALSKATGLARRVAYDLARGDGES